MAHYFQANDIVKYYKLVGSEAEVVYNKAVAENVTKISEIDTSKMFAFIAHFPGSRNIDNIDEVRVVYCWEEVHSGKSIFK